MYMDDLVFKSVLVGRSDLVFTRDFQFRFKPTICAYTTCDDRMRLR